MRLYSIIKEFFYTISGALVIFSAMEILKPDIVLGYLNLNWLLIIWILNGIVLLIISAKDELNSKN